MSSPRKVTNSIKFNGSNVTTALAEYLESITYTDVASGSSDQLDIDLYNLDMKWMNSWYPVKGDKVSGSLTFQNWEKDGDSKSLSCGTFTLDDISFSGGPLKATLSSLAIPASEGFKSTERTVTWSNVTIKQIAQKIATRYSLTLSYSGSSIKITSLEQSQQADSEFLYNLCEDFGLAMKVYRSKIVIFDQTTMEKKTAVATVNRASWIDDGWEYNDTLLGVYTGARISYKASDSDEEISVYLGLKKENASGSRVLKINETANSVSEAYYKAAAMVNKSNESATTISGDIIPNPKIVAGACITISGLGKANGKYYVDKSTMTVSDSGTKQTIEAHKCQTRLTYTPATTTKKTTTTKTYKKGDLVTFKGGTHYVSSYKGAKGYSAKAGPAKITLDKTCAGNGGAHPYHLIHTNSTSNVYGWVDEGTFE